MDNEAKEFIKQIVFAGTPAEKMELYSFDKNTKDETVLKKFKVFARANFIRYFTADSAPFHDEMVENLIKSYRGENFINLAFRGSSKTSLKKLFVAYAILNDKDHLKRYIKINCRDIKNSKQFVTDVFNLCIEVVGLYGNVFEKEDEKKREERMDSFTLKSGVKLTAGTVGQSQRGHIQDAYRPDWVLFDDIEDRESISSQAITESVIARCDEAITGLAKNGSWTLSGNYISENGTIQWFINKKNRILQITPIMINNIPTWNHFNIRDIEKLKSDAEDFYGEYMCDPARAEGKFFDINRIEEDMKNCKLPVKVVGEVKYWIGYMPHHRYGIGADTAEGKNLDSSALSVFDLTSGELVATYHSNTIKPELFAWEMARVGKEYGECVIAPEINNYSGGVVITSLRQTYPDDKIYREIDRTKTVGREKPQLGWQTNAKTKPQMFMDYRRDYNDGLIKVYDINVLKEMKSFTNADLIDTRRDKTQGRITRHFDLLTSVVIGWQVKGYLPINNQQATVTYHDV